MASGPMELTFLQGKKVTILIGGKKRALGEKDKERVVFNRWWRRKSQELTSIQNT